MIMECNKDTQKLLQDNIEIANQTLIELKNQDQQFINMDESLSNIEYFSKKSKDIIKRMGGFFKRIWLSPVSLDLEKEYKFITLETEKEEQIKDNENFDDNLEKLKNISLEIGNILDKHNTCLDKMDFNIDKNKSYINKNNRKINKLL